MSDEPTRDADDVAALQVMISDLSYKLGQWQAQAEAFARYERSGFKTGEERRHLLQAFDELRAHSDGEAS